MQKLVESESNRRSQTAATGGFRNYEMSSDVNEAVLELTALFQLHGALAGRWDFKLRDSRKYRFDFETADAMKAALDMLPGLLNATLRVNAEWNESRRQFEKGKTPC